METPRHQLPGQKEQITVVACGNAAGNVLPPLIIFDAKSMQHAWTQSEVPGSKYGTSDKGWITTELFETGLMDSFCLMQSPLVHFFCFWMDKAHITSQM